MSKTGRMSRIVNYTCTLANTWYKAYDENDYKNNRIVEVKVKLREGTTADHFRYGYTDSPASYITSCVGWNAFKNLKKLYVYVPTVASQVIEIEIFYS